MVRPSRPHRRPLSLRVLHLERDFFLYDWKARRAIAWYGEEKAHLGLQVGGVVVMIVGVLKLIGLF